LPLILQTQTGSSLVTQAKTVSCIEEVGIAGPLFFMDGVLLQSIW